MPSSAVPDLGPYCLPISQSGFTDNLLYTALWRHSDKNSAAINNLNFVQTQGCISLVNDNHVDSKPKEILVYVMYTLARL